MSEFSKRGNCQREDFSQVLRPSLPYESLILKVVQEEKVEAPDLGQRKSLGGGCVCVCVCVCVCGGEGSGGGSGPQAGKQ